MDTTDNTTSAVLICGKNPSLVSRHVIDSVAMLGGEGAVHEIAGPVSVGELEQLLCQDSFFGPSLVVVRDTTVLSKETYAYVVGWLADPERTGRLVAVFANGLRKDMRSVVGAGGIVVVEADPGRGARGKSELIEELCERGGVRLSRGALGVLSERVGEDLGRVPGIVDLLAATYGGKVVIGEKELEALVGSRGDVPPWELSDAIDRGDTRMALMSVDRMLRAGRAPLAILAGLTNHFERMFRLCGSGISNEAEAAEFLGMKGSTYPARKAIDGARAYGNERLEYAVLLIGQAGVDLKGGSGWDGRLVIEVLVGRLATNARRQVAGGVR
jgi:DNA polymerase-3 subunit delta